jgi:hypothetical protein
MPRFTKLSFTLVALVVFGWALKAPDRTNGYEFFTSREAFNAAVGVTTTATGFQGVVPTDTFRFFGNPGEVDLSGVTSLGVANFVAGPRLVTLTAPDLGTAANFAILAGGGVTDSFTSSVRGDVGVGPGAAITGLQPQRLSGIMHAGDEIAVEALNDLRAAYDAVAALPCDFNLTDQELGGKTLTPGVYCLSSSAQLTGVLILDAQGDPEAVFIFKIAGSLTTAGSLGNLPSIVRSNGALSANIFFHVGDSATIGEKRAFRGNILTLNSITLSRNAILFGRALALNGMVTLNTSRVERPFGKIRICKIIGSGFDLVTPFTFNVDGRTVSVLAELGSDGTCADVGEFPSGSFVTVQEVIPPGVQATSTTAFSSILGDQFSCTVPITGSGAVTFQVSTFGNVVTFTNRLIVRATPVSPLAQSYFKNHPEALPTTLTIGRTTLSRNQMLDIFRMPVRGNGAIQMTSELIATLTNVARGVVPTAEVQSAIIEAQRLLAGCFMVNPGTAVTPCTLDKSLTSGLTEVLTAFNKGKLPGVVTGTGTLRVCKSIESEFAAGTPFEFDIDGITVIVPVGTCVNVGEFPVGTELNIRERILDDAIPSITVNPAFSIISVFNSDVTVRIGTGVTAVTFTNHHSPCGQLIQD